MIDPTKTTPEKLAEMNDSLIVDNNHLRAEITKLRKALTRALVEAEGWCDEATGRQPKDIMGYDGWHDEASALLK